jgi:hypothetical protein
MGTRIGRGNVVIPSLCSTNRKGSPASKVTTMSENVSTIEACLLNRTFGDCGRKVKQVCGYCDLVFNTL